MNILSVTNPQWGNAAQTAINLTVDFDTIGVVPFTASAGDTEPHGITLFNDAIAGKYGPIAAYVAPAPVIPTVVSMAQARHALLNAGLLATVDSTIANMTGAAGDAARIDWGYRQTVDRNSPLVASLSTALGLTSVQLDSLFASAATF